MARIDEVCGHDWGIDLHDKGEMLYVMARWGPGEGRILEVGSALGRSTACLALGSKDAGREIVVAIDHHEQFKTYDRFRQHMVDLKLLDWVQIVHMDSERARRGWGDTKLRLIFIDGEHTHRGVQRDIHMWVPLVIEGGLIVWDDYSNISEVTKAIDEFLRATKWDYVARSNLIWTTKEREWFPTS